MKQVLFILLVFISFQGFSQETVKLKKIGLEVMKKDLGIMIWRDVKKACADLGDGWRLPTKDELISMAKYKEILGFETKKKSCIYWSSTESFSGWIFIYDFKDGDRQRTYVIDDTYSAAYLRVVRDL